MKIVFTSCIRYLKAHKQKEWLKIKQEDPDHLLLLGDNIYMDWGIHYHEPKIKPISYFRARMRQMYRRQWGNSNFKNIVTFMTNKNGFHGIWDDHDCGWDNIKVASLKTTMNIKKIAYSKKQFFKHFPLSNQHQSIYYYHDTPLARLIFLDNRSYATTRQVTNKTLLGTDQLQFLEDSLQHSKPISIICAGLTLSHGRESFATYESDYERICTAAHNSSSKVIFLSGDIHKNRFAKPNEGLSINGIKPPFEITSSGMWGGTINRHHRWCMLEILNGQKIDVTFHEKPGHQTDLGAKCSQQLNSYLQA